MIFEERDFVELPLIEKDIIYFLLQDDEVVYVGQSKSGCKRPYEHLSSKQFNKIMVVNCDEKGLDRLEDFFIRKYSPKYNKILNNNISISFNSIKTNFNISIPKLKKVLKCKGINYFELNNTKYLFKEDLKLLGDEIDE